MLSFGPFRFDAAQAVIWRDTEALRLSPKACAVLAMLVAQPGQVVSKDALLAGVWPDVAVTEAVLAVYVGELRRAFGETARAPHCIETVHRRGYRFMAPVTRDAVPHPPPALAQRVERALPLLVGRDAALAQLHARWRQALGGARQVVFVTGEPGMGKTALLDTFLGQLRADPSLWMARGQCIAHYGSGEAYLPLLDALGHLWREGPAARVLEVLQQYAPTWMEHLPAYQSAPERAARPQPGLRATPERMLRELAEALDVLTAVQPLVLVLEDLHWSDLATLDLLAWLARRRQPARLLLLGTYRPVDVIVRQHPLRALTQDLALHQLCSELPLELLNHAEVRQHLTTRYPGQMVPETLASVLYQRTEGNPLFLVTLVETLERQGSIWGTLRDVDEALRAVPQSVGGLVEQQLGQCRAAERRMLEVASVAGSTFAAAALAASVDEPLEAIEHTCSTLARQGQFLRERGLEEWPDGTVTACYSFRHVLYQQAIYGQIAPGRRRRLHQQIGQQMGAGCGTQVGERAAELAMHFEHGRDYHRAVQYVQQAAENAARRSAPHEVIALLTRGLALLATLPETPARAQQELALQVALGPALQATQGYGAPEVEKVYTRARELCQQGGDTAQFCTVLWGLYAYYLAGAELRAAVELGEQCLALAERTTDAALRMEAHRALGNTLLCQGEFASARAHLEQVRALYDPQQHCFHALAYAGDPGVACLSFIAWTLWFLGYPDQALQSSNQALTLAQALSHPYSLGFALYRAARLHQYRREGQQAFARAGACVTLSTEQGFTYLAAMGTVSRGWALAWQGQGEEGRRQIGQGLAASRATGTVRHQVYILALLAEAYQSGGQIQAGLDVVAEALAGVERTEERWYEAELHRLKGELLLHHDIPDVPQAEVCFQQALAIARRQQAKSWELRAAMSLSRMWQQQGKQTAACELLAPVYGWFTEGFDTADLQEAKTLLTALEGTHGRG
jgi:predicted ATPase/DNA-binding winged helix-turn-helix (wHTH) protein